MNSKKTALLILDGWGFGKSDHTNAIHQAETPFINQLYKNFPHAQLLTDGINVGLPEGQMGNSEVGHLNIGAGRVVYQDLAKINLAVSDGSIDNNHVLNNAFEYALNKKVKVHFIGLLSDGGIHSHQNHLYKLCELADKKGLQDVFIHAFTDGRDTDPKSGINFIKDLQSNIADKTAVLSSVIGRYYAMDRDTRWERVKLTYDMLCHNKGKEVVSFTDAMSESYHNNITDEFIKPLILKGNKHQSISSGDVVVCFNFRTDRCREISMALSQIDFPEFDMKKLDLHYVTMTNYDRKFKNVHVMFDKDNLSNTLGECLSKNNKTQVRIAETEKYPHVSFFFSGGREKEFDGERRIMIPSPKVATYDLQPSMSAHKVSNAICDDIKKHQADFICLNFANPDMVGHTGVLSAVKEAVETVDSCTQQVVECALQHNYSIIIIADHGNAEFMVNADGSPNTAHTTNPVPIFLLDKDYKNIQNGRLADVAPTILKLMKVPQPLEMNGIPLI